MSEKTFLQSLFDKIAATKQAAAESGADFKGAEKEVERQICQASSSQGGDPISGEGVTKSGGDD